MRDISPIPGAHAGSWWRLPPLARLGWILYVASMLTPASAHAHFIGAFMLIVAPAWGLQLLCSGTLRAATIGICLLAGFAANASPFVRLPAWARIGAMLAPWLCYAASLFAFGVFDSGRLWANAFFFPWAAGIALINVVYLRLASLRARHEAIAGSVAGRFNIRSG